MARRFDAPLVGHRGDDLEAAAAGGARCGRWIEAIARIVYLHKNAFCVGFKHQAQMPPFHDGRVPYGVRDQFTDSEDEVATGLGMDARYFVDQAASRVWRESVALTVNPLHPSRRPVHPCWTAVTQLHSCKTPEAGAARRAARECARGPLPSGAEAKAGRRLSVVQPRFVTPFADLL